MLSNDLSEELQSLEIDEQQNHVVTRITNTKKGVIIKENDHNILITELKCYLKTHKKKDKVEINNLKNTSCQKMFEKNTSETNMLSSIFYSDEDLNILTQRLLKKLDGCIKMNFKKVRINYCKKKARTKNCMTR